MEDFLLIRKMKQGDEEAFDIFIRKYYAQILKYCRFHCFDTEYAEDLTQETFLKFFGNLQAYHHMGKTKNYLYTIAGNLCKNLGKKKSAEPVEQTILEQELISDNEIELAENRMDVQKALMKLSPELREVILLYYYQELKLREVADILQIGLPLVKYRLKRGKEELKALLGKESI